MSSQQKKVLVEQGHPEISIVRQCELLDLNRSTYYLEEKTESAHNLQLMRLIDEEYTRHPFYGSRKMAIYLNGLECAVNRKRVQRLMRLMGLEAMFPKPQLSRANQEHRKYPYLLNDVEILYPNQVWSTDITYIRTLNGFLYLAAVIDWHSRYVLGWALSNTMEVSFCLEALEQALRFGQPEIFNTDQGSQFTCMEFIGVLERAGIKISMDGKGRAFDNIFIERLWRSLKYEEVYLKEYRSGTETYKGLKDYFEFYNDERPHQSLEYKTPRKIHFG